MQSLNHSTKNLMEYGNFYMRQFVVARWVCFCFVSINNFLLFSPFDSVQFLWHDSFDMFIDFTTSVRNQFMMADPILLFMSIQRFYGVFELVKTIGAEKDVCHYHTHTLWCIACIEQFKSTLRKIENDLIHFQSRSKRFSGIHGIEYIWLDGFKPRNRFQYEIIMT